MIKFFWDFRGEDAAEIAEHYKKHLDQFIINNNINDASTGVNQLNEYYYETWCLTTEKDKEIIDQRLKPKRQWKQ